MGVNGDVRGKSKQSTSKTDEPAFNAPFRGFINVQLTEEQKAGLDAWLQTDAPWRVLETMASSGVGIAVKLDPKSAGFMASATQRNEQSTNAGLVVTTRGKSAYVSLMRLLFTLAYLSTAGRWEDVQPMADPDRW
jgi:hypothetical protein